jgi:hypothetical protein
MSTLPILTDDPARQAADLDRYGYCMIANALDDAQLAAVRQRIEEQAVAEKKLGVHRPGTDEEPGEMVNQWVHMLVNKGRVFHDIALSPIAMRIARHVLGEQFLLSDLAAHITWPDNGLMGLHIDQWWLPPPAMPGETYQRAGTISRATAPTGDPVPATRPISPPAVLNVFWAITDFTAENGATRLVPGSHLSGLNPDPNREDILRCRRSYRPARPSLGRVAPGMPPDSTARTARASASPPIFADRSSGRWRISPMAPSARR